MKIETFCPHDGKLPAVKVGRDWMIKEKDLKRLVKQRKEAQK